MILPSDLFQREPEGIAPSPPRAGIALDPIYERYDSDCARSVKLRDLQNACFKDNGTLLSRAVTVVISPMTAVHILSFILRCSLALCQQRRVCSPPPNALFPFSILSSPLYSLASRFFMSMSPLRFPILGSANFPSFPKTRKYGSLPFLYFFFPIFSGLNA